MKTSQQEPLTQPTEKPVNNTEEIASQFRLALLILGWMIGLLFIIGNI